MAQKLMDQQEERVALMLPQVSLIKMIWLLELVLEPIKLIALDLNLLVNVLR